MRLWPFGSKAHKPAPLTLVRPSIVGVDGGGEMITTLHPPVYQFKRLEDVSPVTKARDDELVAALMELETCDVCCLPMNICSGHAGPHFYQRGGN